ncbi:hypothetical protein PoB_001164900 [Plakobranchus ocellatus]|uniref:Uncharacterized protein n=1 Tax=Plakobranchus ocellatus TaxID=259542 RepID=A0AAV3YSY3_9GAST|nr:hypothetical protein PoB_001164900 [Plakobranchus ocellatus]
MSTPSRWSASFTVVLVLSLKHHSQGFLSDDETVVSLTPFDLTYTPAHVVRHVTRDVKLLCAHQTDDQTQLQEVSWIRMLMKTSSGWGLLAEQRDNEDEPQSTYNVSVSGRITKDIKDTFLQITWPVATEETFGTALGMDRFSTKNIFRVLMVFLFALTQYCEAVAPLLGWGFNIVSIKRDRISYSYNHQFDVKFIKEQEANVRIAYCGKVFKPCLEPRSVRQINDGFWLASFILNTFHEMEFSLFFSSVKGENLRLMDIRLNFVDSSHLFRIIDIDFLDVLNVVTVPAGEVVYSPGKNAMFTVR